MHVRTNPHILIFFFALNFGQVTDTFAQGFWGGAFPAQKIKYAPKHYVCYKIQTPLQLDGKLDDPQWINADWTDSFVDIEGNLKPKPIFDTKVKMLWDSTYFYFGAHLEEPHVWAKLTQRDAVIFKDNDFEIFLDPEGDTHNYYELEVNAFATEWDLLLLKPYHDAAKVAIDSWDIPGLITKVYIDGTLNDPTDKDGGWSVEIAIPWKALEECAPYSLPREGEQWKVDFSRVQWNTEIIDNQYVKTEDKENNWVWSPPGIIYMHMPERWGLVQFTNTVAGQGRVEFQDNNADRIKWALRQIYYQQGNYYVKNKRFTTSLKELGLQQCPVDGVPWPAESALTLSGWEASIKDGETTYFIRRDGKVWSSK